jgi:two-component system, sensor histidine kinase PdtaS
MRISIFFFVLFLFFHSSVSTAQNTQIRQLETQFHASPTSERAVALSKAYQEQANWYKQMPQFRRDSTVFYFDKAVALLEANPPLQYERLADLFRDITDRANRSHNFNAVDSLAPKGWAYYEKIPEHKKDKIVGYDILINWSSIKAVKGEVKRSLELFTKALELIKDDNRPFIQAKLLKDKGRFYIQYGLPEDEEVAFQNFQKSMLLYQNLDVPEKNAALIIIYKNLINHYETRNQDSTDYYMNQLNLCLPQMANPFHYAWHYSTTGRFLLKKGERKEARATFLKTIQFLEQYKLYIDTYAIMHACLGDMAETEGKYDEAIDYYKKAIDVAITYNLKASTALYLEDLSKVYALKGDYKKALYYNQEWAKMGISLEKERNENSLRENELQLNVLQQEKELAQKNSERNIFTVVISISLLLLGLLAYIFLKERRSKAKLAKQNHIIEEQSQALRQLDASKTRFFANVSHELRTPLTLMLGPLGTALKSETLDSKNAALLSLTKQNAQQLLGLVNEILDLTKLESGKMTVHEEPTDAYNFLRRLVATFESYATQKNIKLIFDFDKDTPRGLMLDKPKVERIVNNLLSNALKFTPKDGVISVKISHKPSTWQVAVTDTGRGIHSDDLPHVFNRFYQTNQTDVPVEGGTGIGLALSKELSQVLGGTLTVESTLGNGATFTLDLPKQEVLGLSQVEEVETVEEMAVFEENIFLENPSVLTAQKIDRLTVLVVEDNPSLRSYLTLILSDKYSVLTAENGQEALSLMMNDELRMVNRETKTDSSLPNLIISDIMMPVMDGFQLIEKLKSNPILQSIPVVMLTARAEMQDRLKALRIGVDDYLTKPFEEEELFARLENLLTNAKMRQHFKQEEWHETEEQHPTETEEPLNINAEKEQHLQSAYNLEWLANLEKTVKQHINYAHLSVDFIADEMYISRAQFYRRVQLLTGLTPNQYLQEIRFNYARQLLEQRNVSSVKAAAAAIGIQKVQYFSEQFKTRFGKLPSAYL